MTIMESLFEPWQLELMKNVHDGAEFLDSEVPYWYNAVQIPELDMASGSSCICGQVFANMRQRTDSYDGFEHFLVLADDMDVAPYDFGFDMDHYNYSVGQNVQYSFLAELWIEEIKFRKSLEAL